MELGDEAALLFGTLGLDTDLTEQVVGRSLDSLIALEAIARRGLDLGLSRLGGFEDLGTFAAKFRTHGRLTATVTDRGLAILATDRTDRLAFEGYVLDRIGPESLVAYEATKLGEVGVALLLDTGRADGVVNVLGHVFPIANSVALIA